MLVQVLSNGVVIGGADLTQLDPPMGVAMGHFEPADHYDRRLHANVIEGDYIGDPGASFVVVSEDNGIIVCVGVAIEDYAESMGERQLTVLGIPYPDYARFFADYPDYKAYYPSTR
jgi:hypothetical protein